MLYLLTEFRKYKKIKRYPIDVRKWYMISSDQMPNNFLLVLNLFHEENHLKGISMFRFISAHQSKVVDKSFTEWFRMIYGKLYALK